MTTGPRTPAPEQAPDSPDRTGSPETDQRSEFIPERAEDISVEDNKVKARDVADSWDLEDNESDATSRELYSPDDRFREERIDNSEY